MILALMLQLVCADIHSSEEVGRIMGAAHEALAESPVTIVAFPAPRSIGDRHAFSSEGDYWWPNPADPDGPYIKRDGLTNPENFTAHRLALIRFSQIVSTLVAAYRLSDDLTYARHAYRHIQAWFVDDESMMHPHLLFAQAIKGRVPGRGIGIIDTIHLIEVARSVGILMDTGAITAEEAQPVVGWFAAFLTWLRTHDYGRTESRERNNHGTWWAAQVASYATLTGDTAVLDSCRVLFRTVLLPGQMDTDGSFPLELQRTRPFAYSLFNLEGMAVLCHILSRPGDDLWAFALPDGRSIRDAFSYMAPPVTDRSRWPYPPDVINFEALPVRQMAWLFAAEAYQDRDLITVWRSLPRHQQNYEVARPFALREPLLWFD